MKKLIEMVAVAAAAGARGACGGAGYGGGMGSSTTAAPAAAPAMVDSFTQSVQTFTAAELDNSNPMAIAGIVATAADLAQPVTVY
jgi:hypothetical protein